MDFLSIIYKVRSRSNVLCVWCNRIDEGRDDLCVGLPDARFLFKGIRLVVIARARVFRVRARYLTEI